jgi:hypothetical protein
MLTVLVEEIRDALKKLETQVSEMRQDHSKKPNA